MNYLNKLKKLCEKATSEYEWKDSKYWLHDHQVGMVMHTNGERDEDDANFIAEARSAIPRLIKALEVAIDQRDSYVKSTIFEDNADEMIVDWNSSINYILSGKGEK